MKKLILIALSLFTIGQVSAKTVVRQAEPLSWWVGMKSPLQIMFYGEELTGATVRCLQEGVRVTGTHATQSSNYLFVDVEVDPDAKPGVYTFEFTNGNHTSTYNYRLDSRREASAKRESFTSSDIIYLIMPDRFANGDISNDNHPLMHEKVDRSNPHARHGGDLKGMTDRLDYLADLGVTTLWSTPLLSDNEPTYSYHGYATANHYRIDPRYGNNEAYRNWVRAAHERDLKVIMDMVPNHIGAAHPWMEALPFSDWVHQNEPFTQTNHAFSAMADPHASQHDLKRCVEGWFDKPMPDVNLRNPYVFNYFTQWAMWWIEWADLDGVRVDTFPYNDKEAIARWVGAIREEYPKLNIVGEVWTNSPAQVAYWDGATNNRDGYTSNLPSVMDFPLQEALIKAFTPDNAEGLMALYNVLSHDFLYTDPRTLLIFADNHDTHRLAHLLEGDVRQAKLVMTLLATLRGVPQLYYGDELLLRGNHQQGHGGERIDFPGGWSNDTLNLFTKADRNIDQQALFAHTQKLLQWRKTASTIHHGRTLHFRPEENVYVFFRYTDSERVMVIINGDTKDQSIDWERFAEIIKSDDLGVDVLSGKSIQVGNPLKVAARESLVVKF